MRNNERTGSFSIRSSKNLESFMELFMDMVELLMEFSDLPKFMRFLMNLLKAFPEIAMQKSLWL